MELAYKEALYGMSKKHGGPFGAVIVKDNEVIAKGHNQVLLKQDPTAHAEVVAIRKACKKLNTIDLSGCTLYASAKPCPMCTGVIQWSRIRNVVFSGDYEDTKKLKFDDQNFSDGFDEEDDHWEQIDQDQFEKLICAAFESCEHDIRY
jgi:tRNA(Arg) A34 adenosine deaminase TadA